MYLFLLPSVSSDKLFSTFLRDFRSTELPLLVIVYVFIHSFCHGGDIKRDQFLKFILSWFEF